MNEKEKKAIDHIKNIKSWWWNNSPDRFYLINKEDIEQFDIVLNLIDKQQKEIDKLNKVIDVMSQELIDMQIRQLTGIDLFRFTNKEDTKQYFIRKVEEDD